MWCILVWIVLPRLRKYSHTVADIGTPQTALVSESQNNTSRCRIFGTTAPDWLFHWVIVWWSFFKRASLSSPAVAKRNIRHGPLQVPRVSSEGIFDDLIVDSLRVQRSIDKSAALDRYSIDK